MQIKSIDNFSLQDCKRFLQENPSSEMFDAVKFHQAQLLNQIAKEKRKNEQARKDAIKSYVKKMQWMDFSQFLETKRYWNLTLIRFLFWIILFFSSTIIISTLYYINVSHLIYAEYSSDQASYVTGLENLLLNIGAIDTPYHWGDVIVYPYWDEYRADGTFFASVAFASISILILLILNFFHSPLKRRIYNIQHKELSRKYRAIQNEKGKFGVCKIDRFKLKKVLPFEYDQLVEINEGNYLCKKKDKIGIYNTELRKLTVPIIYDDVYAIEETSVQLVKNGNIYSFTNKGYRIVD